MDGVVVIVHTVCLRMPGFGVVLKFLLALTDWALLKTYQTPLVCEWSLSAWAVNSAFCYH